MKQINGGIDILSTHRHTFVSCGINTGLLTTVWFNTNHNWRTNIRLKK